MQFADYLQKKLYICSVEDKAEIIRENARRNAEKKKPYDQLSGEGCAGVRISLTVEDKRPGVFYLPEDMKTLKAVHLLKKHKSVKKAVAAAKKKKNVTKDECDYFWYRLCEERIKYDFEFYAITHCFIEDKLTGNIIPFRMNPAQRMIEEDFEEQRRQKIRVLQIVLKAKQMGFSTYTEQKFNWIQNVRHEGWNSTIVAHVRDAAINIRAMYETCMRHMLPIGGVQLTMEGFGGTQNIKWIPERRCRITVGFATEPESTRSQNVKLAHFSEVAFYPSTDSNNPAKIIGSIVSSATKGEDTAVVLESTANGRGDYFEEQWQAAKSGETAYHNIFAPFCIVQMYEEPFDGAYFMGNGRKKKGSVSEFISTLTDYEWTLWHNDKRMTLENLNWRRMQAASMPSEAMMRQEYPANDIEAFQDSGQPVFNSLHVEQMRKNCEPPEVVGVLKAEVSPSEVVLRPEKREKLLRRITFVPDNDATDMVRSADPKLRLRRGVNKLHIWEMPDREVEMSDRYVVAFDPQRGITDSADYGVIKVFDRYWMAYGSKPKVVAMYYGHLPKDETAWLACQVAEFYCHANLVIEANTYESTKDDETDFIFDLITGVYDNMYSHEDPEKVRDQPPTKYGFWTDTGHKRMIIDNYQRYIASGAYIEKDAETLNEANYFERKPNGSFGAKGKQHDDRIMCTIIGLYVAIEQMPTPRVIDREKNISKRRGRLALA